MIINTNMASLNTLRQLGNNEKATHSSLAKLSSGLKINSAADDAAGLAISEKMRGQISGLNQASANAQNGISLVSTAEGALNETTAVLQRMRELAVSAGNDTNTTSDRTAMQTETTALLSAINDIGNNTQFNTKNLLNGSVGVQMSSTSAQLNASASTADTKTGVYAAALSAKATQATITGTDFTATAGTLTVNGSNIVIAGSDSIGDVASKINNMSSSTGVTAIIQKGSGAATQKLVLQSNTYGSSANISVAGSSTAFFQNMGMGSGGNVTTAASGTDVAGTIEGAAVATGSGLNLTSTGANSKGLAVSTTVTNTAATFTGAALATTMTAADSLIINGNTIIASAAGTETGSTVATAINAKTKDTGVSATWDATATKLTLTSVAQGNNAKIVVSGTNAAGLTTAGVTGSDGLSSSSTGNITVNTSNVLQLQIGANQGQSMAVGINDMRAHALGVDNIDLTTQAGAAAAITTIDAATNKVSSERSNLGAFQNRLEHTINNLGTSSQNVTTAEANIRDVDMAKEMTNFQKNNILQQAAQSMLAQANQQGQGVLKLLQ